MDNGFRVNCVPPSVSLTGVVFWLKHHLDTKFCRVGWIITLKALFPFSETSELLAYDATQAQDVERVRLNCSSSPANKHSGWRLARCPQVAEDIEYLKFEKGPWAEQDDVSYHHIRMLWVIGWILHTVSTRMQTWAFYSFLRFTVWKINRGWQPWHTYPGSCQR